MVFHVLHVLHFLSFFCHVVSCFFQKNIFHFLKLSLIFYHLSFSILLSLIFCWPQLPHDFLTKLISKTSFLGRLGENNIFGRLGVPPAFGSSFLFFFFSFFFVLSFSFFFSFFDFPLFYRLKVSTIGLGETRVGGK